MIKDSETIEGTFELPLTTDEVTQRLISTVQGFPKGPLDTSSVSMDLGTTETILTVKREAVSAGNFIAICILWAIGGLVLGMGIGGGFQPVMILLGIVGVGTGAAIMLSKDPDTATVEVVDKGEGISQLTWSGRIDGALRMQLNALVGSAYGVQF